MRGRVVEAWGWLERHPRRGLGIACALAVMLRVPFVGVPLSADEGGFTMVAEQWHSDGSSLYGDQWVDRPPLLIAIFKVASWLPGDDVGLRLMALLLAVTTVVAAWFAGRVVNGPKGAVAAALVAAALSSSFALDGHVLTGEGIGSAFVMVSCALTLQAAYQAVTDRSAMALAGLAGVFAAFAFLTKQNFVDAALFAFVLVVLKLRQRWRLAIAGAAGIGVPLIATAVWAQASGPGVVPLWNAIFRFRQHAFAVMESSTSSAPLQRLSVLLVLVVASGIVLLTWQLIVGVTGVRERRSLRAAVLVMLCYALASITLGGNWWRHYLLELAPVLALGTALATQRTGKQLRTHVAGTIAVASAIVSAVVGAIAVFGNHTVGHERELLAGWLRDASQVDDSIVLAYGMPSIIEEAELSTPYRYSWSLPVRARDPRLTQLVDTLRGPDAPTWLVEVGDFDWWGLDNARFRDVRADRYRLVAAVCGHDVYLLDGAERALPPDPACP